MYPKIETLFNRDPKTFKVTGELRLPEFALPKEWLVTEKIDGTNIRVEYTPEGESIEFKGRTDAAEIPPFLLDKLKALFGSPDQFSKAFQCALRKWSPEDKIVLYGEGYGARIQKGGGNYREGVNFRLFDVLIYNQCPIHEREKVAQVNPQLVTPTESTLPDPVIPLFTEQKITQSGSTPLSCTCNRPRWWLNWEDVCDVANKLGIKTVPVVGVGHMEVSADLVRLRDSVLLCSAVAKEESGVETLPEGIVARTDPLLFCRNRQRLMWKLKGSDFAKE